MGHRLLVQPDDRSCGAAVAVVCRMLAQPAWADRLLANPNDFTVEVLATHRRLSGRHALAGQLQLPWPRALGTSPWGLANELSAGTGIPHRVRIVWPHRRRQAVVRVRRLLASGAHVPLYIGNSQLPRHVVLLTGTTAGTAARRSRDSEHLEGYDPSMGGPVQISTDAFVAGTLAVAGWSTPWFTIEPTTRRTPA